MDKKKKILFHSNHCKAFTGFGKNAKNVLKYLYGTGKYEIIEAANGFTKSYHPLSKSPWKCVGTLPDDRAKIESLKKDPSVWRSAGYGSETIDSLIKEFKPDIYIGAEDIWAFNKYWERKWWSKINSMIWTTLDSEPILPLALEAAKHVDNYYVWAGFAEREMKKQGFNHVKTLHGIVDDSNFFKLSQEEVAELRSENLIDSNCFLIGFVFRNQLRKSVPNLLDGFLQFKNNNPSLNTKLLLHTSWSEGWDIPRLISEKKISNLDVLTTYYCSECNRYQIKPFSGEKQACKFCGSKDTQSTTSVSNGVSEDQLNEIYNLLDVYCHPFTSGGQEIPIQEAKLCELITLTTNYSCGEEHASEESGGLPLEWAEYREPGTQFIKASTIPSSISNQLQKVYEMPLEERSLMGEKARKFILDNYSTNVIGNKLESILDNMDYCEWDFDFSEKLRDPEYMPPNIEDDSSWLCDIYSNILKMDVDPDYDEGHIHWMKKISEGISREKILAFFKQVASKENSKIENVLDLDSLLSGDDPSLRLAIVLPGSAVDVFMINSFISNLKDTYKNKDIYVFTQPKFFDLIEDNPDVHKVLPYSEQIDSCLFLEGEGSRPGYFSIAFFPTISTQKVLSYTHNGEDINNLYPITNNT